MSPLLPPRLSLAVPDHQDQHCLVSEVVDFPVSSTPALFFFKSIEIPKRTDIKEWGGFFKAEIWERGPFCPFAHSSPIYFLKMIITILYTSTQIHLGNNTFIITINTQPHISKTPPFWCHILKAQNLKGLVSSHPHPSLCTVTLSNIQYFFLASFQFPPWVAVRALTLCLSKGKLLDIKCMNQITEGLFPMLSTSLKWKGSKAFRNVLS